MWSCPHRSEINRDLQQQIPVCFSELFSSDYLQFWRVTQQRLPAISASYSPSECLRFLAGFSAAIACGLQRVTSAAITSAFQRTIQQRLHVVFSGLLSSNCLWSSANYSAAITCGLQRTIQQRLSMGFSELFSSDCKGFQRTFQQRLQGFSASYLPAIARVFGGLFSSDCLTVFQRAIQRRLPVILSELFSSDYLWSSVITCERLPAICQQAIQVYFQFWFSAAVEELSQGRLHQFDLDFIDCGSGFLLLLINCGLISLACCGLLLCLLWILVLDFVLLSSSG